MRFISRCYLALGRKEEALYFIKNAIKYLLKALEIKYKSTTYINEVFSWDETIPNLLSICYYYLKDYNKSLEYINKALLINPKSSLLKNNKQFILNK